MNSQNLKRGKKKIWHKYPTVGVASLAFSELGTQSNNQTSVFCSHWLVGTEHVLKYCGASTIRGQLCCVLISVLCHRWHIT